jgi:tRNA threonylcarbamoyl adenosine modification protein YeaZ
MNENRTGVPESVVGEIYLSLVTCGPQLEVALYGDTQRTTSLVRLGGVAPRSTLVLAAADLLIEDAGLTPDAVSRIVVSRGPGSFTGIRAGLATAAGLAAATGAQYQAYDSLLMMAARCGGPGTVWSAQPGRRGEVYARSYEIEEDRAPHALGEIEIVAVDRAAERGPWVAAEALDLGGAERAPTPRSSAEALLRLVMLGVTADPAEPLYVEGPPIQQRDHGP